MAEGDTYLNALIGAVTTVVLSFTVFSPILGGGVAAYLQGGERSDGARIGALSGVIAAIPLVFLFVVFGGFFFTGAVMGPGMGASRVMGLLLVVGLVFGLVWNVALSAAGGYLGVYLLTETDIGN